ncbi:hypothetical protein ACL02T_07200 [Pseudonocardia sp. RS010]
MFARTAARFADDVALRTVGEQRTLTWSQYRDRVADVAGGG